MGCWGGKKNNKNVVFPTERWNEKNRKLLQNTRTTTTPVNPSTPSNRKTLRSYKSNDRCSWRRGRGYHCYCCCVALTTWTARCNGATFINATFLNTTLLYYSARGVLVFAGRMCRILVPGGLVVAGRDALRSHVEVPAVRHTLGHDAEGSADDGDEFDGVHADTAEMFRTTEFVVPKSKRRHAETIVFETRRWVRMTRIPRENTTWTVSICDERRAF